MFCRKCGCSVEKGRDICEKCAATADKKKKKKVKKGGKKWIVVLSIVAAVLVLLAVIAALCWPAITRLWRRAFMDPTDYLKEVQIEALETDPSVNLIGDLYDALLNWAAKLGTPQEHTVTANFSDEMMILLESADETKALKLNWLDKAELKLTTGMDGMSAGAALGLSLNDAKVLDADAFLDILEAKLYVGAPDINETYVSPDVDLKQLVSVLAMFAAVHENDGKLPNSGAVEQLLRKYMAMFVEQYEDAQKSTETVTIGDMSCKCTVLQVQMTQKQVNDVLKEILQDARTDETAKALLQAYCDGVNKRNKQDEALTPDMLIDSLTEKLNKAEDTGTVYIIKTYVDSNEQVCGRSVETDKGEKVFKHLTLKERDAWGSEILIGSDLQIRGDGKKKDRKVNGTYIVTYKAETYLHCKLQDLDGEALEKGQLRGTVNLVLGEKLTKDILSPFVDESVLAFAGFIQPTLEIKCAEESTRIGVSVAGKEYMDITVTGREIQDYKPQMPEKWVSGNLFGLAKWLKEADFTKLLESLKAAKMPEQTLTEVEKLIKKWTFMAQFV